MGENLYQVAGTGMFADRVNQDMSSEGYVYRHLIKTGNSVVVDNPGRNSMPAFRYMKKTHVSGLYVKGKFFLRVSVFRLLHIPQEVQLKSNAPLNYKTIHTIINK